MKRFFAVILLSALLIFGFSPLQYSAAAETEFIPTSYKYVNEENENQIVMIDLQTDDFAVCRMIEKSGDGSSEFARINANYTIQDNILTVTAVNGEHLGDFYIGADNQLTAIYYEDEESESKLTESAMVVRSEEDKLERILLPVLCGIAGLFGSMLLLLLLKGKLLELKKIFLSLVSWFKKEQMSLADEGIDLKEYKEKIIAAVSSNEEIKNALEDAYNSNKEQYGLLQKDNASFIDLLLEKTSIVQKQYDQIREILIKIVIGTPELIRNGIADEIVNSYGTLETTNRG